MKNMGLVDSDQLPEDMPMVVTTENGELLLVTGDDAGDSAELSAAGAEIVVVETEDGQQQIQLVTGSGGQVLSLPPELASRLKENLSGLVDGEAVQEVTGTEQEGEMAEESEEVQEGDEVEERVEEMEEEGEEIDERVEEIEEGVEEIEEGGEEIDERVEEIEEGGEEIDEGVEEIEEVFEETEERVEEIEEGVEDIGEEGEEIEEGVEEIEERVEEIQEEDVEIQEGDVDIQEGVQEEVLELPEGSVMLPEGGVMLPEGSVLVVQEGSEEAEHAALGREVITLQVGSPGRENVPEGPEPTADPLGSQKLAEGGEGDTTVEGDVKYDAELVDFMKVEDERLMSDVENIEEDVEEDIGEFLGDLGFTGPVDSLKAELTKQNNANGPTDLAESPTEAAVNAAAADKTTEAVVNAEPEWTESTVTSASGAELTIRLPATATLNHSVAAARAAIISQTLPPRPSIRVIRPGSITGPPVQPPPPPPLLRKNKQQQSREEEEAWAARTRRRASRGIARAVRAVRRAEDSDSFDSEEEEPTPARGRGSGVGKRGRPRKAGGFSCQLCPMRLETQAKFFQHLRSHYEKNGEGEELPAVEELAAEADPAEILEGLDMTVDVKPSVVLERLEPIAEEDGGDGGPSVLNVDIIASSESAEFECDQCEETFFSEDDLERHMKVHLQVALVAAEESSDPESEGEEEPFDDLGEGPTRDPAVPARPVAEPEPPDVVRTDPVRSDTSGTTIDPAAASQYELKNLKKCPNCVKLFTNAASLRNHIERMHSDGPVSSLNASKLEYECEECHVTYTSQKVYERHKRLHRDQAAGRLPHRCSACGASYLTSMLLAHHQQREHPVFERRRPKKPQYDGPPRPTGRPPGSANKDRQAVYDMIRYMGNDVYGCSVCGLEGKTKHQMFYHISMKHKALRGFKCSDCDREFFTMTALRVHRRTHTGERPFACLFCPKRFRQLNDLSAHVTSLHTLERPYRCKFCDKAFARKYSLTVHMRCHTNERNYKCHVCNKGFRASTYLSAHMKIHTGEKSHACPICHKTFRMRSDMKRHIFTHSRERPKDRSLRALTVQMERDGNDDVVLLDASQLCLQLVDGEDGEAMVVTEDGQTVMLDGAPVIDEKTGQLMVPESATSELDETTVASMYLMADSQQQTREPT